MNSKFYMAGTEGTGAYIVYVLTLIGRLGVRALGGDTYRVRVEPVPGMEGALAPFLPRHLGWKQPGDGSQPRFSVVVGSSHGLREAVGQTLLALGVQALEGVEWNPQAPDWAWELVGQLPEPVPAVPAPATPSVPAPAVVTPTVKVEGNDPAALRAEASLLRQEASDLREQARRNEERAGELLFRAQACEARAAEIERALMAFSESRKRLQAVGVPVPVGQGLIGGLSKLPKKSLLSIAEAMGLKVAKSATKAQIAAAIVGA